MSAAEKAALMLSRGNWCLSRKQIHTDDLPWLLADWLPEGCLGVPADAQPGSQDFFLRLNGGVVGFALNTAGESSPTHWSAVRDELSKAPALPAGFTYTLVLWSLNLAPEMRNVLGTADMLRCDTGVWCLTDSKLEKAQPPRGASAAAGVHKAMQPEFTVGDSMDLVVANPHAPTGGGLHELVGSRVLATLQDMSRRTGGLSVALLADWTAPEEVAATPAAAGP